MRKLKTILAATTLSVLSSTAYADGHAANWTLDPAVSNVSFGSIKNDYAGESHSFGKVSGTVSAEGLATIELGLGSVQTNIDIRRKIEARSGNIDESDLFYHSSQGSSDPFARNQRNLAFRSGPTSQNSYIQFGDVFTHSFVENGL